MKRLAFGERADRLLPLIPSTERSLIVTTARAAHLAVPRALEIRSNGAFDLVLLVPEGRAVAASAATSTIVQTHGSADARRAALERIPGSPAASEAASERECLAMRDLALLAERWLVRSWRDYRRLCALLGVRPRDVERFLPRRSVPLRVGGGDAVVVWAPEYQASYLGLLVVTLEEFGREMVVVCQGGEIAGTSALYVQEADAAQALERCALIVDGSLDDPSHACAFLAAGYKVAAARSCGVTEYVPGATCYEVGDPRSIVRALGNALASPQLSVVKLPAAADAAPLHFVEHAPLVSLVVRTIGRLRLLERALQSIHIQTYPNCEIILVNDGRDDLQDVATRHGARYLKTPGGNNARAANGGFAVATGAFIGLVDDDDALFPDHVEKHMTALHQSKAVAAHSEAVSIFVDGPIDLYQITGISTFVVGAVQVTRMLVFNQLIGASRVLFRRELLTELGPFNEWLRLSNDYEFCLRIAKKYDFVHVDAVTSMYSWFLSGANSSQAAVNPYINDFRILYAEHPVGNRSLLRKQRTNVENELRLRPLRIAPPKYSIAPVPLFSPNVAD